MRRGIALALMFCLVFSPFAGSAAFAAAPVGYLPGVTEEMTDAAYWTEGIEDPDAVLATAEDIAKINDAAIAAKGSGMLDLKNLPATYDGVAHNEALKKSAEADAAYYLGWIYDETGKKLEQEDYDKMIANCADPDPGTNTKLRYGIAVNRTLLMTFPYDGQLLDDPVDFDFDYLGLVGVRMNEPVAVYGSSADGKFLNVSTSCLSGWLRVEDVAICKDKEEWLSAWDIEPEKRLVFWGDKMYTDYSKTAPETSRRLITMGTVLERMDLDDPDALVINRLPLHNYAVWLPVRNDDGSYSKKPALINAKECVSEDYLPLTAANLAKVALASLGDAYGWGGTLNNEDCSSLDRNVYLCFGLDLPRNVNLQWPVPMAKIDTTYMTTEEKYAVLDSLPLGTILNFSGHQMLYLGKRDGKYYVVSSVSSIMSPNSGKRQRVRSVNISALDLKRANGQTWIQAINRIYVPWQYSADGENGITAAFPWYHASTAYCLEKKLIDPLEGGYFKPEIAADRATAVEAIWRMAGKPEPAGTAESFADIKSGAGFEKAALWAREQGIVSGTADGNFDPAGTLTREQFAAMLFRWLDTGDTEGIMGLAGYEDSSKISAFAYDAMRWAVLKGVISGDSKGLLRPKDAVTRAELASIVRRVHGSL